jgi:hypothetical protein
LGSSIDYLTGRFSQAFDPFFVGLRQNNRMLAHSFILVAQIGWGEQSGFRRTALPDPRSVCGYVFRVFILIFSLFLIS